MFYNRLNLKLFSLIFAASLLLSACVGAASTTPTLAAKPQATPTAPLPTFTPTDLPTDTITPRPSRTPSPPEPTETPFFKATEIAEFPIQCTDFGINRMGPAISPDGNWVAVSCGYKRDPNLEIVDRNGKRWTLNYKDYLLKEYIVDGHTPIGNLYPKHWSADGRYLYFTSYIGFDGGGTCFYGFGAHGLYRIDVKDGAVSPVLPLSPSIGGYDIAFSPTGRRLAYQGEGDPIILDLQTGDKLTIKIGDDDAAGNFTWSPDGLELAYSTCKSKSNGNDFSIEKSAIKIYSIRTNTSRTVLEIDETMFFILSWEIESIIEIAQGPFMDGLDGVPYDLNSSQWLGPTPTPIR